MIRGLARLVFLRFLPRRLLPVLTAWEVVQLVRNRRRAQAARVVGPGAETIPSTAEAASRRTSRRS